MPKGYPKNGINKGWIKKGEHRGIKTELKKGIHPKTQFKKGERISKNTEFKKGQVPINKGKIGNITGMWKGKNATCQAKHQWIIYHYGNPKKCEDCGLIGEKIKGQWNIDWSNIDHKYYRNRRHYIGRCKICHEKYDIKFNNKYKNGRPK